MILRDGEGVLLEAEVGGCKVVDGSSALISGGFGAVSALLTAGIWLPTAMGS